MTLGGGFTIGNNIQGQVPQAGNTFQWADNLSRVAGKHTLKFGGDVRRYQFNQLALFGTTGGFYFFGGGPNDPGFSARLQAGSLRRLSASAQCRLAG